MEVDLSQNGYYLIPADEEKDIIFVPKDACPPLEFLQDLVGGPIERICMIGTAKALGDLIMNEEGRVFDLKTNVRASELYFQRIKLPVVLVGDAVVLCGKARLT